MKHIPLREFQLHASKYLQDLPLVLTVRNTPVATINPFVNSSVNKDIKLANKVLTDEKDVNNEPSTLEISMLHDQIGRCEAPNTGCRLEGKKYLVGFMTDEGIQKKKMFLCSIHLKKARAECDSVNEI